MGESEAVEDMETAESPLAYSYGPPLSVIREKWSEASVECEIDGSSISNTLNIIEDTECFRFNAFIAFYIDLNLYSGTYSKHMQACQLMLKYGDEEETGESE